MQSQKKRRDESRVLDIIRKSMLHQNVNLGHADWKLQLWAKCLCVRVNQGGVSVVTHCLEKETRPKNGVHGRE